MEDERDQGAREQAEEDTWGQPPSHTTSRRVKVKVRYAEVRKAKNPEAKGRL